MHRYSYLIVLPRPVFLLSIAFVTHAPMWHKNIKWTTPKMNIPWVSKWGMKTWCSSCVPKREWSTVSGVSMLYTPPAHSSPSSYLSYQTNHHRSVELLFKLAISNRLKVHSDADNSDVPKRTHNAHFLKWKGRKLSTKIIGKEINE